MIQAYCLSVIYLFIIAALYLVDSYRRELSFVILIKGALQERRGALMSFFIAGLAIAFLSLVCPVAPGPIVLGDLLPSLWIIHSAFFFRMLYSNRRIKDGEVYLDTVSLARMRTMGIISASIAAVHFLFPAIVLI